MPKLDTMIVNIVEISNGISNSEKMYKKRKTNTTPNKILKFVLSIKSKPEVNPEVLVRKLTVFKLPKPTKYRIATLVKENNTASNRVIWDQSHHIANLPSLTFRFANHREKPELTSLKRINLLAVLFEYSMCLFGEIKVNLCSLQCSLYC